MSFTTETTRIVQFGATSFEVQYLLDGKWQCFKTPANIERARILRNELIEFGLEGKVVE